MGNYNETITTGEEKTWERVVQTTINNPESGTPIIRFTEEVRTVTPSGKRLSEPSRKEAVVVTFDPMKEVTLLNPETDEVIGVARHIDAYVILYSIWKQGAVERDSTI